MATNYSKTQRDRLIELGADVRETLSEFVDVQTREDSFRAREKELAATARKTLGQHLSEKHIPDTAAIIADLERWLVEDEGFTKVVTSTIIPVGMLDKMSISDEAPLRAQVFSVDKGRCLRPMLAPSLYVLMRELHRITCAPVRIFECGSCFRKETQGAQHMNEFTMLNFVEFAACKDGEQPSRLKTLAAAAMRAVGIDDYTFEDEGSVVYGETLDIVAGDIELASGSFGPHSLDGNWGVFEPWVGFGFGIERIAMVKGGHSTIKRVGRGTDFIDGIPLHI
ncbi:MAG: pyrrolysine--tRNA(Pyl) ligase large subunit [Clostridiales Family XIII bacterium]|jgi:phenylalanyl-tRNA synthetase alpha chain|nr:pyrrolysine--tRNA(Pyl) ligase large subunit [Clostridiales Family XIII bacterium]